MGTVSTRQFRFTRYSDRGPSAALIHSYVLVSGRPNPSLLPAWSPPSSKKLADCSLRFFRMHKLSKSLNVLLHLPSAIQALLHTLPDVVNQGRNHQCGYRGSRSSSPQSHHEGKNQSTPLEYRRSLSASRLIELTSSDPGRAPWPAKDLTSRPCRGASVRSTGCEACS